MAEYEYLFTKALHEKLKEKIVGRIFIRAVTGDRVYVRIDSFGDLKFTMFLDDFSEKIKSGYSSDYACYEILKQYKKVVLERYFT